MEGKEPALQYAALCWRGAEVLLITSRATGRWIVPKGWPMEGLTAHDCAAQEAWEEAGVRGTVGEAPVGVFHYDKRKKSGRLKPTRVEVFALEVTQELDDWPERDQRRRQWFAPGEAAALVGEPELQEILRRFRP